MENNREKLLIESAQKLNKESFDQLIANNLLKSKNSLYRSYPNLSKDNYDDILQSTLIRAWNKLGKFRGDCSFYTWFFTILRNETASFLNKKNKSREISTEDLRKDGNDSAGYDNIFMDNVLDDVIWQDSENVLEKKEDAQNLRKLFKCTFSKLNKIHSQVLRLHLEQEKSYKEISKQLNLSIGTVMSRLFYARKEAQRLILAYSLKNKVELPLTFK